MIAELITNLVERNIDIIVKKEKGNTVITFKNYRISIGEFTTMTRGDDVVFNRKTEETVSKDLTSFIDT